MPTEQELHSFVHSWIESWNNHDLEKIIEHYAEDLHFYSPITIQLNFNAEGIIKTKSDLKQYFAKGLSAFPDLHFHLHNIFYGINTVVAYYTSVNGKMAAELFEINEDGKAQRVFCNYSSDRSTH